MHSPVGRFLHWAAIVSLALGLLGCGGNEKDPVEPPPAATYSMGGTVSGLGPGKTLMLKNNGGDNLSVGTNGAFTFPTELANGTAYAVTVTAPAGQTCAVTHGNGTINAADVTNVAIACTTPPPLTYSVGGTVSGLGVGKSVILKNNNTNNLTVSANGAFTFTTRLPSAAAYAVIVGTDPVGQHCTVTHASGAIDAGNVSNVTIACADSVIPTYSVGGTVSGLANGKTLVLSNNSDDLTIDANGAFTFPGKLLNAAPYAVSVLAPVGQSCTVTHANGNINAADVTNVAVACVTTAPLTYSVGGTVSGLGTGKSLVLKNNGGDNLNLNANGAFTFPTTFASGAAYNVSVTAPAGQTCAVSSGGGTIGSANVTNVSVTCTTPPPTYSVGGTVSGLGAAKTLVLTNNGGNSLSINANGTFTFTTKLLNAATYAVAVATTGQPAGQTCTVSNGSGTVNAANVTNVNVNCADTAPLTYSVGGSVSGLGSGKSVVLTNNNGNNLTVNANGAFTFTTQLLNATAYVVAVAPSGQPAGQTCTVSNGTGTISAANVTNVAVACVTTGAIGWSNFTTTATTLVLNSNEALDVNSPFYGIQVTRNGKDITDDIKDIITLSPTSWRYTFKTEKLNEPGEAISVSLQNTQLAVPGHYIAWPEPDPAKTVQGLYARLQACEANTGECAGAAAIPNLVTGARSIKGFSKKYYPRDIQKADGTFDFSPIFADAAFLASKQLKLNVIFIGKSFSKLNKQNGNGSTSAFDIPNYQGNSPSPREVRVYVNGTETAYTFNTNKTKVQLATAPPPGDKNVVVAHALDPFPDAAWAMDPPVGGWYLGDHPEHPTPGIAHAPWRQNCVDWMEKFMAGFQAHWIAAIAANPAIDKTIESVSVQESYINPSTDYSEVAYRAGLGEYAKFYARAVRRRAVHEQLINFISGGIGVPNVIGRGLDELTGALIPWGSRFGGPDLLSDQAGLSGNSGLEFGPYTHVHRARHNQALTMIWAQNDSFHEPDGSNFFTMTKQFEKAKKSITDTSNANGYKGLGVDYVFWNMTDKDTSKPELAGSYDWRDALKVISSNPIIQTVGADRNRWLSHSTGLPISDQSLSKVN